MQIILTEEEYTELCKKPDVNALAKRIAESAVDKAFKRMVAVIVQFREYHRGPGPGDLIFQDFFRSLREAAVITEDDLKL